MVCSSCENSGHLSVAVAQFTVAEEPERNLEIIDGFARDAAVGDREADLITAELSRECLDSAHRTLPVLQNRRFADPHATFESWFHLDFFCIFKGKLFKLRTAREF